MLSWRHTSHSQAAVPGSSLLHLPQAISSAKMIVQGRGQRAFRLPAPCQKAVFIFRRSSWTIHLRAISPKSLMVMPPAVFGSTGQSSLVLSGVSAPDPDGTHLVGTLVLSGVSAPDSDDAPSSSSPLSLFLSGVSAPEPDGGGLSITPLVLSGVSAPDPDGGEGATWLTSLSPSSFFVASRSRLVQPFRWRHGASLYCRFAKGLLRWQLLGRSRPEHGSDEQNPSEPAVVGLVSG